MFCQNSIKRKDRASKANPSERMRAHYHDVDIFAEWQNVCMKKIITSKLDTVQTQSIAKNKTLKG